MTNSTRHFGLLPQSESDLELELSLEGTTSGYQGSHTSSQLMAYALLALGLEEYVWLATVAREGRRVGRILPTLAPDRPFS